MEFHAAKLAEEQVPQTKAPVCESHPKQLRTAKNKFTHKKICFVMIVLARDDQYSP